MADTNDMSVILNELAATRVEMVKAVRKMRHRNIAFAVLSVISLVLCAAYLAYAAIRFGGEVTPDLIAANVQTSFMSSLPKARAELEKNLQTNAPKYVGDAFEQLQAMPAKYTAELRAKATQKMDEALPQVQDQMYTSMKDALTKATQAAPSSANSTDEVKMKTALAQVASVYASESSKFVDQVHATYASQAIAFTDYMDTLARNQGLDHKEQLYREMFRTAFALVKDHANNPSAAPMNMSIIKPVQ